MRATENKRHSFGWRLSVYALFLLALTLIILVGVYFYIAAYEYTRPESAMQRYLDDLQDEAFQAQVTADFLDSLDHRLQPEEESRALLREQLSELRYAKKVSECTDDRLVYVLKGEAGVLGKITLEPSGKRRMGFDNWQAAQSEFYFDTLCRETEIVAPADCQVRCGEAILDRSYVVDDQVHYALLEEFYEAYSLPTLYRYSSGKHLGELELEVLDAQGRPLSPEQLEEERLTDNCSAAEKAALKDFAQAYLERYVTYLSGANGAHTPNLFAVVELTVKDSDLYSRLYQALGGQGFSSSHGDYLQSVTVNHMMSLGEGRYLIDATYLVETFGQDWVYTVTTNNSKILVQDTPDGLRAFAQASY